MFPKNLRTSLAAGVLVWLAYAQVEYFLCSVVPLRFDGFTLPKSHWAWTAIVFGAYAAAGVLSGLLTAAVHRVRRGNAEIQLGEAASFSALTFVTVYFAWLMASGTWHGTGLPATLLALTLGACLAWNVKAAPESGWRTIPALPWVVPVLLLVPFKIVDYWKAPSPLIAWTVVLSWTAAIAVAGLLLIRVRERMALPESGLLVRRAILSGASCLVLFAMSAVYSRGLPPFPQQKAQTAGARPNVLLVIWDTVRADRESVYDYQRETTPFLRRFAENATLFKNAFAASDMTLSSSASLFTGMYASWHGAHFSRPSPYGRPLPRPFQTIATVLRGQGYTTMAELANCSYLGPGYQLNQGYQLYDVRTPVGSDAIDHGYYLRGPLQRLLSYVVSPGELDRRFRRGDAITEDALQLLGAARGGGPFFLTLNYMDAHLPYLPPAPYDKLFPGKDPSLTFGKLEQLRREVVQLRRRPNSAEMAHMISQYDGAIAFLDAEFQRLVTGLKQLGLYDSTLIVLTADHGEAQGERNLMEHGVSVYQDQVHVPLMVKYPQQTTAAVVTAPVSGIDVMPTILEAAGVGPVRPVQGRSLRQASESRLILSESFRSGLLVGWNSRFDREERSLVKGSAKLIQSTSGKRELYNLESDPKESTNLFRTEDPLSVELSRSLAELMASAPAVSTRSRPMDKESLDRLRGLGYVQ
jgi:arylsulfatase A-like enzyme